MGRRKGEGEGEKGGIWSLGSLGEREVGVRYLVENPFDGAVECPADDFAGAVDGCGGGFYGVGGLFRGWDCACICICGVGCACGGSAGPCC